VGGRGLSRTLNKRALTRASPLFLILLIGILAPSIPLAHAAPILFSNTTQVCTTTCNITANIAGNSEIIILGQVVQSGCVQTGDGTITITDSFGTVFHLIQFVRIIGNINVNLNIGCIYAYAGASLGSGTDTITTNTGQFSYDVQDYTGFTRFGTNNTFVSASTSGTNGLTINVNAGSVVIGMAVTARGDTTCGPVTTGSSQIVNDPIPCQTASGDGSIGGLVTSTVPVPATGSYSDSLSWGSAADGFGRFLFEIQGSNTGGGTTLSINCFGNCGNPPITLAKTNSTHTINFNVSITILYAFQSTLNGFIVNMTVNVAKDYFSTGEGMSMGIYEVDPSCPAGTAPFSPSCPGFLQISQTITAGSLGHGQITLSAGNHLPVTIGQFVGIGISGFFKGLDLNDTNTQAPLLQTNGRVPTQISQTASLNPTSLVGMWSWIIGNAVGTVPPGTPGTFGGGCGSPVCGLNSLVAALGGGVFGGIVAFGLIFGTITGLCMFMTRQHDEQGHIRGYAFPSWLLGIIAILLLLGMSAAGALPSYVTLIVILFVSYLFASAIWSHRREQGGTGATM